MDDQPVIIVTGASQGLGAAIATWLGRIKTIVVLVARTANLLAQTADAVNKQGGTPLILPADVAIAKECTSVVEHTLKRFGRLDALINNAGIFKPLAATADADPEQWRYNIEVNLLGPYNMARASIGPLRQSKGRIINVSSGAAVHAIGNASAYCAAKAGLNHFTRVLADEEPSLTIVAVRPGVVDTAMQTYIRAHGPGVMAPDQANYYLDLKADNLLEPPEVPAGVIAWLALKAPRSISGDFIDYDDPRFRQTADAFFAKDI
jgi:NAD(P)-dependent dehydrogenase (short-subunit alcohol dehydrogenase family)